MDNLLTLANNNFEDGLQFIEKLEKLFDSDFDSYKEKLNNIKREHDKQMAKEKRTLEIVSISFYTPDPPYFW